MKAISRWFFWLALWLAAGVTAPGQPQATTPRQHLADYDSELRRSDGRVDTDALVRRLTELGATTYYWLIWHAPTDWDDLKLFLPKAGQARVEVWVYLVPPSEGPATGSPAPEPFGLDYLRWGEEIARLSLQHTNLTAWVMDDFYANHKFFTAAYVRDKQARAKRINPRLAFLPLMYFPEITRQFVASYGEVIDGVVAAYPKSREEIISARTVLKSDPRFHLPLIVMTAGVTNEFSLRHGHPASPERMAEWLRFCLQAWRDGQCDGVVTYCLDKRPRSQFFPLAQNLFREFRTGAR